MKARLRIPVSTYRLQFNRQFSFQDALHWIAYLDRLGITDIYASPIFKSRRNSLHGYDVVDPTRINPDLGGPLGFERLSQEIRKCSMGLVLDIVPNHMAADPENPFWVDFLQNGLDSPCSEFFDIDRGPCDENEGRFQIVLPVLAQPYSEALVNQEIFSFDR